MRTFSQHSWIVAGVLTLASCVGITLFSGQFVYGENHASRPIVPFLAVYLVAWIGFVLAVICATGRRRIPLSAILAVGVLARLVLLSSGLIQENDCYRYVLDGEALLHGVNPYAHAPADVPYDAPARFREAAHSQPAQVVLYRVGYPDISTIYPPAAQAAFALGAFLTPWSWTGQRIVLFVGDMLTMAVLLALLRKTALPSAWLVFYAWNPLILKEVINSVHIDGLVALWLALTIFCIASCGGRKGRVWWAALGGCALACATLTKLYPAMLAPVVLAYLLRERRTYTPTLAFLAALTGFVVLAYLPFLGVGWEQLTAGLRVYAEEWRRNDGAFALLATITSHPRLWAAAIVVVNTAVSTVYVFRSRGGIGNLVLALQIPLLVWFLFLPAAYPWYAIGLLAVTTLRPRFWAVVLSGVFGLYYLQFWVDYHEAAPVWHTVISTVEHGAVWATVIASLLVGSQPQPNHAPEALT